MIFVDDLKDYPDSMIAPRARKYGVRWCHMVSDASVEELIAMGQRIGLRAQHLQQKPGQVIHFDLTPYMRDRALATGAVVHRRDAVRVGVRTAGIIPDGDRSVIGRGGA